MKIFIYSVIFIFQFSSTLNAQNSGAANSASGANLSGIAQGAMSMGMGGYLMHTSCPPADSPSTMMCVVGASLVVEGAADAIKSNGYKDTGSQIAATDTGGPSSTDAVSGLDPYSQGLLDQANQIAAQNGTTLPALASQAADGGGGGGGGDLGSLTSSLPQSVKDGLAKVAKDVAAHYNVSSVALEGGGGGSAYKGEKGLDLSALMNSLKGDRGPASVEGLQKSLNGQPIGVAQDNIFKQVTRKYQSMIAARMFLPIQK